MIDHFTRHPKTGRATELDPATFTPADEDRGLDWLFITVWGGMFLVAGLAWWGIYEAALAVWEMI